MSVVSEPGNGGGPGVDGAGDADPNSDSDSEPETLSREDAYEIIANRRRRHVIHYLQRNGRRADLGTIAEHVAAWENDVPIEAITTDQRKRVYTSLQQFHLPKMADRNVVHYDSRSGAVALTDPAADLDIHIEIVDEYDIPWSLYYLGLAGATGVLFALSVLSVGPFGAIPLTAWGIFVTVALATSALAHTYITYQNRVGTGETPPGVDPGLVTDGGDSE